LPNDVDADVEAEKKLKEPEARTYKKKAALKTLFDFRTVCGKVLVSASGIDIETNVRLSKIQLQKLIQSIDKWKLSMDEARKRTKTLTTFSCHGMHNHKTPT
jgi:hypothetical protein